MSISFKHLKVREVLTFLAFPAVFYAFPRQVVKFFQFFRNLIVRPPVVEPDLAKKPSWANYLAQSVNGYWKWYKEEPVLNKFGYWVNSSKQEVIGYTPLLAQYRTFINLKELATPEVVQAKEAKLPDSAEPATPSKPKKSRTGKKQ